MLSNDDLAELIEAARDRVQHMAEGAPAAMGVVHVLNGLITMLREQEPADAGISEPVITPTREPRRRPVRASLDTPKPANPLLGAQYAGFFQNLIAQQKAPAGRQAPAEEPDETDEQTAD